jgi:ammonia channel protein AmtB
LIDKFIGLRVSQEEETDGLDINQHDQQGYSY